MYRYKVEYIWSNRAYTLLRLAPNGNTRLEFEAGQYVAIAAKERGVKTPMRCFSIVSAPGERTLELAFRRSGDSTESFSRLRRGDPVEVMGPFGDFVLDEDSAPAVFLAGGIGITPFVSMLRDAMSTHSSRRIALLASTRTTDALPYAAELKQATATHPSLSVDIFSGGDEPGTLTGRIDERIIRQLVSSLPNETVFYLCGPDAFVGSLVNFLLDYGVSPDAITSESFTQANKTYSGQRSIKTVVWGSLLGASSLVVALTAPAIGKAVASASPATSTPSAAPTQPSPSSSAAPSDSTATSNPSTSATTSSQDTSSSSPSTPTSSYSTQSYSQPSYSSYSQPVSSGS